MVLIGASVSEPHIDDVYIYICRMSCHKSPPARILRLLESCVNSNHKRDLSDWDMNSLPQQGHSDLEPETVWLRHDLWTVRFNKATGTVRQSGQQRIRSSTRDKQICAEFMLAQVYMPWVWLSCYGFCLLSHVHANTPRFCIALAHARPTMSCILLVNSESMLYAVGTLLVECRILEGEPERSALYACACRTCKEQLHSHDCHQNVTGQWAQKLWHSWNIHVHSCTSQQLWVRLAFIGS